MHSKKYLEYVIWRKAFFYRQDLSKITKMRETLATLRNDKQFDDLNLDGLKLEIMNLQTNETHEEIQLILFFK